MNSIAFQVLARERLSDADALLLAGRFDCAYYVAGYAVECALKACIAGNTRAGDFPPRETRKIYTHDLEDLLESSGLSQDRRQSSAGFPERNWSIVKDWSESARYERKMDRLRAEELMDAISNPKDGVLQWLVKRW